MNFDREATPPGMSGGPPAHGRRAAPRAVGRRATRKIRSTRRSPNLRMVFASLAAGLLAAPYLIPANADTIPPAASDPAPSAEPQTVSAAGPSATLSAIERDAYTVTAFVPNDYHPYSRTASTFVNDPNSPIQWPFIRGVPIVSGFGPRAAPCDICSTFHKALDFAPGAGTPIQAIADGVVSTVNSISWELGVHVKIDHMVDGQKVSSLYAHMQEGTLAVGLGEAVTVGHIIGRVGNTGLSMGPHLHFEILLDGTQPTDPYAWLTARVGS